MHIFVRTFCHHILDSERDAVLFCFHLFPATVLLSSLAFFSIIPQFFFWFAGSDRLGAPLLIRDSTPSVVVSAWF